MAPTPTTTGKAVVSAPVAATDCNVAKALPVTTLPIPACIPDAIVPATTPPLVNPIIFNPTIVESSYD